MGFSAQLSPSNAEEDQVEEDQVVEEDLAEEDQGAVIQPVLGVCQRCEVELYCVANPVSLPTYVDGCRPPRCAC